MKMLKEGFPNQVLVRLPMESINRMKALPICSSIYVTDIGHYPEAKNHLVKRPNGTANHIVIYCLSGNGWIRIGDQELNLSDNQVVLIPAKTAHSYGTLDNKSWNIYWLHFNGTVADAVFSELLSQNGRSVIYLPRPDPVISAFNETIRWSLSRESMSSLIAMGGSCMHLLGLIIHGKRPAAHKARAAEERISESIVLIKNTLNEPLTLKQLAAEARLSVPHYASLFKKKTGSSPIQMYAQMRIQLACDLLDRSNLSVSAVSDECGYSDPFYFSRTFKRIVGLAPTQYRDKSPNYHAYIDNLKRSQ